MSKKRRNPKKKDKDQDDKSRNEQRNFPNFQIVDEKMKEQLKIPVERFYDHKTNKIIFYRTNGFIKLEEQRQELLKGVDLEKLFLEDDPRIKNLRHVQFIRMGIREQNNSNSQDKNPNGNQKAYKPLDRSHGFDFGEPTHVKHQEYPLMQLEQFPPYPLPIMPYPNYVIDGTQASLNSKQFCINTTEMYYSQPQIIYLLDTSSMLVLIDKVFENIFYKGIDSLDAIFVDYPKFGEQNCSFLKFFYAFFAEALLCYKTPKANFEAMRCRNKAEAIPVDEKKFCLEQTYANLFLADYSYHLGKIGEAIRFSGKAVKISKGISNEFKEGYDVHKTNALFQYSIYLMMDEYVCISHNQHFLDIWDDLETKKFEEKIVFDRYKSYGLFKELVGIFDDTRTEFFKTKTMDYGHVNSTIITASFFRMRLNLLLGSKLNKKKLREDVEFAQKLVPIIEKLVSVEGRRVLLQISNFICMEHHLLLKNYTKAKKFAEKCLKVLETLKLSNDHIDEFNLNAITQFYYKHDFYKKEDLGWIENTKKCLDYCIKKLKQTSKFYLLVKRFEQTIGKNVLFESMFERIFEGKDLQRFNNRVQYAKMRRSGITNNNSTTNQTKEN